MVFPPLTVKRIPGRGSDGNHGQTKGVYPTLKNLRESYGDTLGFRTEYHEGGTKKLLPYLLYRLSETGEFTVVDFTVGKLFQT